MRRFRDLVIACIAASAIAQAQTPRETFEVATIKQNTSGGQLSGIQRQPGGRVTITNMTLRTLITFAYQITGYQLTGGPGWADRDRFDVLARMNGNPTWGNPGSGVPDPAQVAMQS